MPKPCDLVFVADLESCKLRYRTDEITLFRIYFDPDGSISLYDQDDDFRGYGKKTGKRTFVFKNDLQEIKIILPRPRPIPAPKIIQKDL